MQAASRYLHDQLGVPLEPERINELVVAALLDQYRRRLPLLPGAVVAVRRLADRWPLALASSANRPVIDAVLEQAGITDCFAVTVSGEEVAAGKPAPDVYLAATRRLGVDPGDAVAVEDSTNGLQAAAAAGMVVIASPNREYPPEPDALPLTARKFIRFMTDSVPKADGLQGFLGAPSPLLGHHARVHQG